MTMTAVPLTTERLRMYLDTTREDLFEAIRGLTEEQMRRRPGEGQWSVAELLAHLPVSERHIIAQARAVCTQRDTTIEFLSDQERAEAAARGRRLPPPALIHDMVAARWETTSFLVGLRPREMSRCGRHEKLGKLTVLQVLGAISYHEREHVGQVRAVRQALEM
jgi:hypothetical protein